MTQKQIVEPETSYRNDVSGNYTSFIQKSVQTIALLSKTASLRKYQVVLNNQCYLKIKAHRMQNLFKITFIFLQTIYYIFLHLVYLLKVKYLSVVYSNYSIYWKTLINEKKLHIMLQLIDAPKQWLLLNIRQQRSSTEYKKYMSETSKNNNKN